MKEINPKQLKTYLIGSIENCADGGVGAKYADMLLAIWDCKSKGTEHMIKIMNDKGKPIHVHLV